MYTMEDFKRKKIIVRVDKDRLEEFLGLCEDEGMLWISGYKPRECLYWNFRPSGRIFPGNGITVCTELYSEGRLAWCNIEDYKCHYDIKIVGMKDFLDHLEPAPHTKYKITIESDGTTTTAHMEINGKQVKSTQAKLHPVDKFNFKTGAEMAFGRLWEGEKKIKKKEPIFNHEPFFKVGDRVVCEYADDNYLVEGKHGKIIGFTQNEFLIEFDDYVKGHNGNSNYGRVRGRNGHCWYCDQRSIHHE